MTSMMLESAFRASQQGLFAHGSAINVLGDNVANANTPGYKSQRAEFRDILGERVDDRVATTNAGAGDGVQVARVRLNFDSGTPNQTGRDLDVAISGRGFFLIGDPAAPKLSRLGNFQISQEGFLTTSDGLNVLGLTGTDPEVLGPINLTKLDIVPMPTSKSIIWGNLDGSGGVFPPPPNPTSFLDLAKNAGFVQTQSMIDSAGSRHDVQLYFFRNGPNAWTAQAYVNGKEVGQAADQPVLLGQTNLTFNQQGRITPETAAQSNMTINPAWASGVAQNPINIDFSNFTQFAGGSRVINVSQDGRATGDIVSYNIGNDGKIMAVLNTGDSVQAGNLALGLVNNVDGLDRLGNGLYGVTQSSGTLNIARPQIGGRGTTLGGYLEASNVDLPGQFTEMIVLQRAYQANSQALSTANDMLKNTIALVR